MSGTLDKVMSSLTNNNPTNVVTNTESLEIEDDDFLDFSDFESYEPKIKTKLPSKVSQPLPKLQGKINPKVANKKITAANIPNCAPEQIESCDKGSILNEINKPANNIDDIDDIDDISDIDDVEPVNNKQKQLNELDSIVCDDNDRKIIEPRPTKPLPITNDDEEFIVTNTLDELDQEVRLADKIVDYKSIREKSKIISQINKLIRAYPKIINECIGDELLEDNKWKKLNNDELVLLHSTIKHDLNEQRVEQAFRKVYNGGIDLLEFLSCTYFKDFLDLEGLTQAIETSDFVQGELILASGDVTEIIEPYLENHLLMLGAMTAGSVLGVAKQNRILKTINKDIPNHLLDQNGKLKLPEFETIYKDNNGEPLEASGKKESIQGLDNILKFVDEQKINVNK